MEGEIEIRTKSEEIDSMAAEERFITIDGSEDDVCNDQFDGEKDNKVCATEDEVNGAEEDEINGTEEDEINGTEEDEVNGTEEDEIIRVEEDENLVDVEGTAEICKTSESSRKQTQVENDDLSKETKMLSKISTIKKCKRVSLKPEDIDKKLSEEYDRVKSKLSTQIYGLSNVVSRLGKAIDNIDSFEKNLKELKTGLSKRRSDLCDIMTSKFYKQQNLLLDSGNKEGGGVLKNVDLISDCLASNEIIEEDIPTFKRDSVLEDLVCSFMDVHCEMGTDMKSLIEKLTEKTRLRTLFNCLEDTMCVLPSNEDIVATAKEFASDSVWYIRDTLDSFAAAFASLDHCPSKVLMYVSGKENDVLPPEMIREMMNNFKDSKVPVHIFKFSYYLQNRETVHHECADLLKLFELFPGCKLEEFNGRMNTSEMAALPHYLKHIGYPLETVNDAVTIRGLSHWRNLRNLRICMSSDVPMEVLNSLPKVKIFEFVNLNLVWLPNLKNILKRIFAGKNFQFSRYSFRIILMRPSFDVSEVHNLASAFSGVDITFTISLITSNKWSQEDRDEFKRKFLEATAGCQHVEFGLDRTLKEE